MAPLALALGDRLKSITRVLASSPRGQLRSRVAAVVLTIRVGFSRWLCPLGYCAVMA